MEYVLNYSDKLLDIKSFITIFQVEVNILLYYKVIKDIPSNWELIDKHAALEGYIGVQPNTKWYMEELRAVIRKERQFERIYRSANLEVDKECCITDDIASTRQRC